MQTSGMFSKIKQIVVPKGKHPRTVKFGLFRDLVFEIDLAISMQVWLGLWERETYPYIRKAAERCAWAVDIGAGKGEHCIYLLRHSSASRIYAFEPQQSEIVQFRRNLELNAITSSGILEIINKYVCLGQSKEFLILDTLDVNKSNRGFIKIDVDGAEMDVLQSATNLLSEGKIDIVVETHSSALEIECTRYLSKIGYQCKVIKNAWWRIFLPEQRPIPHNRWLWATKD